MHVKKMCMKKHKLALPANMSLQRLFGFSSSIESKIKELLSMLSFLLPNKGSLLTKKGSLIEKGIVH